MGAETRFPQIRGDAVEAIPEHGFTTKGAKGAETNFTRNVRP